MKMRFILLLRIGRIGVICCCVLPKSRVADADPTETRLVLRSGEIDTPLGEDKLSPKAAWCWRPNSKEPAMIWLGWLDSNQRMEDSKSPALPLGDTPTL